MSKLINLNLKRSNINESLPRSLAKNPVESTKPIILAPAGNMVMLTTAINAGADAVYFGVKDLNMRITANNFELSELKKIADYCHKNKVLAYLTLNTIIYEDEIPKAKKIIAEAKKAGIDAIIAWDMAIITEALKQGIDVHLSTQASVSNYQSLKFYGDLGVKKVVLARECTLLHIKEINDQIKKDNLPIKIETFIHGAMCVSLSGRCFMSQFLFCKSANRGDCLQSCRREYDIVDKETKDILTLGNNYVMSAKDLCTIIFIDKLIEAGISCFKIEGRAKSPEYVNVVVSSYRKAIDAYYEGKFSVAFAKELEENMKTVFNRGFSDGFFMGAPINEFTDCYGWKSNVQKDYVGFVKNFYAKIQVAEIKIESGSLCLGDLIMIQGPSTGVVDEIVESMQINHKNIKTAEKGKSVAVKLKNKVRPKDKVFVLKEKMNN